MTTAERQETLHLLHHDGHHNEASDDDCLDCADDRAEWEASWRIDSAGRRVRHYPPNPEVWQGDSEAGPF